MLEIIANVFEYKYIFLMDLLEIYIFFSAYVNNLDFILS